MSSPPRVSVVMPIFQAERYLTEAIESVRAQTFTSWELLLVDDGSTDGGSGIARTFAATEPERIRYLEHAGHENLGKSATRNLGVEAAQGQLVAFLDADDVYLPQKLEAQVALIDAHPEVAMIFGRTMHWESWTGQADDPALDHLAGLPVEPETIVRPPALLLAMLQHEDRCPSTCGVLVRRGAILAVGGFEVSFRHMYEDLILWAKIFERYLVYVSGGCYDRYRLRDDNSTAVAIARGEWRPSPLTSLTRGAYLRWIERYVAGRGSTNRDVYREVRRQLAPYAQPMSLVETLAVEQAPLDARLVGRNIDRPRAGEWGERLGLDILGWVLGRSSPAVAVEIVQGGTVLRRAPLGHWRPDLATAFPDVPDAGRGGYSLQLELLGLRETALELQAVLADQSRVPLGSIRVAGRWRKETYHAAAPLVSVVIPCYDQARYLP
ncbi:MAG: glycosyltransferase family 2 protein, partial [Chloroflexi bacterium]|nr:glycosyltransferase family 2 protein [Chloroflexota bacterium]